MTYGLTYILINGRHAKTPSDLISAEVKQGKTNKKHRCTLG